MKLRALALVALFTLLFAAQSEAAYTVGEHIDDFTLNDAYGTPVSLYDYEGMAIWLDFWTDS